MLRITNIEESLDFYCGGLGLKELNRYENEEGRFTLLFLASEEDIERVDIINNENVLTVGLPMIELTFNWTQEGSDARFSKAAEILGI